MLPVKNWLPKPDRVPSDFGNVATMKATWKAFNDDKVPRLASAIAYSTIFSLVPLLILFIALAGFLFGLENNGHGHHLAEDALLNAVASRTGKESALALRELIAATFNKPRNGMFAQISAWITFMIGAMGFFGNLQDALNTIWNIEKIKGGFAQVLHDRLVSLVMLLLVSIVILVSFGIDAVIIMIGNSMIVTIFNQVFMIGIMTVVFGLLFKILPDVTIEWRDVASGAFITGIFFFIGDLLLTKYLAITGIASAYGAAGSLLVILVWIYYSAMIVLLGAEFTKVTARHPRATASCTTRSFREIEVGEDPRFIEPA
jgi:membrane protein